MAQARKRKKIGKPKWFKVSLEEIPLHYKVLAAAVVLTAVAYYVIYSHNSETPVAQPTTSAAVQTNAFDLLNRKDDATVYAEALSALDVVRCYDLFNTTMRNKCMRLIGVAKKDPSICEKILHSTASRDNCYREIAQKTGNTALCYSIKTDSIKAQCTGQTTTSIN